MATANSGNISKEDDRPEPEETVRPDVNIRVGCAGWSIPKASRDAFPDGGPLLQRYAGIFNAVEINSTFYRPHMPRTFERWAESTPPDFRFSVKLRKEITHVRRLCNATELLQSFLEEVRHLGDRLGPILVQLPPSFAFDPSIAVPFFLELRELHEGAVVCEPRHASWFEPEVDRLLNDLLIARAAADPSCGASGSVPGGDRGIAYFRWHGSPRMYYSAYSRESLAELEELMQNCRAENEIWCIFDNTALGHAYPNALEMMGRLR